MSRDTDTRSSTEVEVVNGPTATRLNTLSKHMAAFVSDLLNYSFFSICKLCPFRPQSRASVQLFQCYSQLPQFENDYRKIKDMSVMFLIKRRSKEVLLRICHLQFGQRPDVSSKRSSLNAAFTYMLIIWQIAINKKKIYKYVIYRNTNFYVECNVTVKYRQIMRYGRSWGVNLGPLSRLFASLHRWKCGHTPRLRETTLTVRYCTASGWHAEFMSSQNMLQWRTEWCGFQREVIRGWRKLDREAAPGTS